MEINSSGGISDNYEMSLQKYDRGLSEKLNIAREK